MSAHEDLAGRIRAWVRANPDQLVVVRDAREPVAFLVSREAMASLAILMQPEYDRIEREVLYGTGVGEFEPLGLLNVTGELPPVQASLSVRQHVARVLGVPLGDPDLADPT